MTSRLIVAAVALALAGCSGVQHRVHDWTNDAPPPTSHGTTRPVTACTGEALPVHATPSESSKVVGRLPANAKVTHTQTDQGWARIKGDHVEGWVDASKLVPQPPSSNPPPAAPAPESKDDGATVPATSSTRSPAQVAVA
jgi:hypothetical protein